MTTMGYDKRVLHRSISMLIQNASTDTMSSVGAGVSNPAHINSDPNADTASTVAANSGCFQFIDAFDNEYDDGLALPDTITNVSSAEDDPRHISQKDEVDYASNSVVTSGGGEIPYSYVHNPPIKFNAIDRKIFIPNVEIHVEIIDYERAVLDHILNPNLYKIQLTHGPFKWVIHKRYKDFNSLHQQLRMFRASLNFPIPTKIHKERRAITQTIDMADVAMAKAANGQKAEKKRRKKSALPKFPIKPDALVPFESIPDRIKQLEEYLYNLLNIGLYRTHKDTIDFLEVSNLSFIAALGDKGKEGMIKKRTGSTLPGQAGCNFCGCFHATCCFRCNYFCSDVVCGKWRQRWIFVKDTCFGYIRPKDGVIRSVVLFDQGFDVSTGMYHTGMRNGLQILTHSRYIVFKCVTRRQAKEWATYLKSIANTQARDFTYPNPHSSFAPLRPACLAGWFVDGASYMAEVANALEGATEEIFITDWWLSPEIYMKRPVLDGDYWRLDKLLQRKAAQGVKIFVLLYKEVEMALGINSYYSKQRLVMQHENIKVMRHPDHARVGVLFWAHHEKLVIIDQTYAFVGGIDLCYGRWDDYRHRLVDMGSISAAVSVSSSTVSRKGVTPDPNVGVGALVRQSRNILVATSDDKMVTPTKHRPVLQPGDKLLMPETVEEIPENMKQNTPEMERRNVLGKIKDNMKTKGRDLMARMTLNEQEAGDASPKKEPDQPKSLFFNDDEIREGAMGGIASPLPFKHPMLDQLDGQAKLWMGKDYVNFIMKDFINLELPYADLVDRNTAPRMPWHDVATVVVGSAARDAARHFIERWNAVKLEKARENNAYPYLMPKTYGDIRVDDKFLQTPLHRVTCQVLRSVSSWNCGFIEPDCIEQSIHEAYLQTILKAQHYIYIENQFFISLEFGNPHVKNQVADTLFKRIIRAFKERKIFRVYVVMPLLPGFEGDVGGITGNSLRAITHWNYASICRGKNSLISRLRDAGIRDPFEYISFHSLRNHSKLNGTLVTELVYVHSKLMIADDKTVICGSANINDRSLIGKRDSEVCVILTDESFEEGRMNGETYPCGIYAGKLRKFLFKEHLGLLDPNPQRAPIDVTDPTIDAFWNGVWRRTSRRNTDIFAEVFHCIPSDLAKTFAAMKKYCDEPTISKLNPEAAEKELMRIQGFLVDLPLEFLCNEILTPPGASKEGLMPQSLWT